MHVKIVTQKIDTEKLIKLVEADSVGAIDVFLGTVRNNANGKNVLSLEYHCYEAMAQKKLEEIVTQCYKNFEVEKIAVEHRTGHLKIGEVSVVIAVSSPHRAASFEACRFVIETIKKSVPIWKKEYFEGGEIWVEGYSPEV
ncbi:molybdenum cofactor biosynthesis protein MoaE [bacterium]|nr:molybdenum cofactor biosynthesis protein MoaE [bacterium]